MDTERLDIKALNDLKEKKHKEDNLIDIVKSSCVMASEIPEMSKPILEIANSDQGFTHIFTEGNISAIKGKAKSRKSFACALIAAMCTYKDSLDNRVFNRKYGNVVYVDTEQSRYHVWRLVNRVHGVYGFSVQADNFMGFSLRRYSPETRLKVIESILYDLNTDISFMIIDGIRDLVFDINDAKESTEVVGKLMKWSDERKTHICSVIHENRSGEGGARGHLGTEITNKAETVLKIEKKDSYSVITPELSRNAEFNPLNFEIQRFNNQFIPVLINDDENTSIKPLF